MNNLEYYKDEIIGVIEESKNCDWFADKNNKICIKRDYLCTGCKFSNTFSCLKAKIEWLLAEHKEQPTITSNEKRFLEILDYKYIARDVGGVLYGYQTIPKKYETYWDSEDWGSLSIHRSAFKNVSFDFIKWSDEEPWAVKDLLKLEVRDENNY